jgi:hypothetical protein
LNAFINDMSMTINPCLEFTTSKEQRFNIPVILSLNWKNFEYLPSLRTKFQHKVRHVIVEVCPAHNGVELHPNPSTCTTIPSGFCFDEVVAAGSRKVRSQSSPDFYVQFIIGGIDRESNPINEMATSI